MIGIVVSNADHASTHIGEKLLEVRSWTEHEDTDTPDDRGGGTYYTTPGFELRTFEELHIYLGDPTPAFAAPEALECIIFVSRHAGNTGKLLTAHVTGNFGAAEYGGTDGGLTRAAPNTQKAIVDAFDRFAPEDYDLGIECTHHGPSELSVPSLFAEVGSDEPQWRDPDAAEAVARAVLAVGRTPADRFDDTATPRHVVGFGGGHYAPRFTRIVTDTDWAVGHIGADWQLEAMGPVEENPEVIERAFEQSNAEHAIVEGTKPALTATIEDLGYHVVSETWVRTVGDRSLELVSELESELSPIDNGLRFGDVSVESADAVDIWPLPAELVAAASGVDLNATYQAVKTNAVAFETTEGATKPTDRVAIPTKDSEDTPNEHYDAIVDELMGVLEPKYDSIERGGEDSEDGDDGETVIARTTGFDPSLAETLGIPEGPAFGKLAAGQSVEVDGRTIDPTAVTTEQVDRFPIPSTTENC
ncbi:D-aminoacyl-tRNA deacylase [Halalkalirubrum salinum]|uniref:D-aminoacyl-tRNA deacylase n=1 Tax=Halalkalirubrum salinum TaxID=2563889 RepID=UPI0010FB3F9D|nr:D-aminoacyl-tRNA deacylase [Halalkalirubrum salinum]